MKSVAVTKSVARISVRTVSKPGPFKVGLTRYHVVFLPKRRRKAILGNIRRQLGAVLHATVAGRADRAELLADPGTGRKNARFWRASRAGPYVHFWITIPSKRPVTSVIGLCSIVRRRSPEEIRKYIRDQEVADGNLGSS